MDPSGDELATLLHSLNQQFQALLGHLALEQRALEERDLDALQQSTADKQACCDLIRDLERRLGATPVRDQIDSDPNAESLRAVHNSLIAKARQAQEYNTVNGRIIHRAQQSTLELLRLFGDRGEPLYGQTGHPESISDGAPIAKA